ncbi:hypothetical protein JOQ06_026299, partial [Pogonophryne albipinna]
MDYTVSLQVEHQLSVFPTHLYQEYSVEVQQDFMEMRFCSCSRCMLISLRLLLLLCTCPAGPHKQLVHA